MNKNQVLDLLAAAIKRHANRKVFGKALCDALDRELPGTCSLSVFGGNSCRAASMTVIYFDDNETKTSLNVSSYTASMDTQNWADNFLTAIEHSKSVDYEERLADEEFFYPDFEDMEKTITVYRAQALAMIVNLPVPKSATIRAEHPWETPQIETMAKFPNLFAKNKS